MVKDSQNNETPREAYRRKLKDPRWQKMHLEIFNRDGFKCQYCEAKKETLHVHHLEYLPDFDPWQYPMELLLLSAKVAMKMKPTIDENRKTVLSALSERLDFQ